jgi:hypothetical protein
LEALTNFLKEERDIFEDIEMVDECLIIEIEKGGG